MALRAAVQRAKQTDIKRYLKNYDRKVHGEEEGRLHSRNGRLPIRPQADAI